MSEQNFRSEPTLSRRDFVKGAAATAAAVTLVPRHVLGATRFVPPSEKVTIAAIGIGDQGKRDMERFLERDDTRIVAVCDVDANNRNAARDTVNKKYADRNCAAFNDFREVLATQKDLDAVLAVVPDHSHAVVSMAALKAGKHVYCQKPFTHTVYEAHRLAEVTRETKLATQLGTANQASEGRRILQEWIEDGAIGGVREVHIWTNRPFWPQGIDRPTDTPPVPATLDWNLWLGPAPFRPYHPAYLPLVFRGWWDFGTGALGDMGCYALDTVFRVLRLKYPTSVEACGSCFARKMWDRLEMNRETFPRASLMRWEFPARGDAPPVTVVWYDGGLRPLRPKDLDEGQDLGEEGAYYVGDKGTLMSRFGGDEPRLVPASKMAAYKQPPKTIPRSIGHHSEWIRACKGGEPAGANFEFSAMVTEAMFLGNVALKAGNKKLHWDGPNLKVTNGPEANQYLHCKYREGWTL
jgi:predicted dehydrogenase